MEKWRTRNRGFAVAQIALALMSWVYCIGPGLVFGAVRNMKISGALAPGDDVADFKISPDGRWVVYRAGKLNTAGSGQVSNEEHDLYSVPLGGGTVVRLNGLLPSGSTVWPDYDITADSLRVVYRAEQDEQDKIEIYSVPIDGPAGAGVKLNGDLVAGGDVQASDWRHPGFLITPDGSRVVYLADAEVEDHHELFSVPVQGPANAGVKLNGPILDPPGVYGRSYYISPDSQWVVYVALQDSTEGELYSVPVDGPSGDGIKLNGLLTPNGAVSGTKVAISPDSSHVVYVADQQTESVQELYSVPIRGPTNAGEKLNQFFGMNDDVYEFVISPDSQWVVYRANVETGSLTDLYSAPISGPASESRRISHDPPPGKYITSVFAIHPSAGRVVYLDSDADVHNMFSTPLAGPPDDAMQLNKPMPPGGLVRRFEFAPDGDRVVYMAEQDIDEIMELYSVPVAGPSDEAVQLNGFLGLAGDVESFVISPDGRRVVYRGDHAGLTGFNDEVFQLWMTSVDGSGSVVLFSGSLVDDGDVTEEYNFAPDGRRVVYLADQDTDQVFELYVSDDRPTATHGWRTYK